MNTKPLLITLIVATILVLGAIVFSPWIREGVENLMAAKAEEAERQRRAEAIREARERDEIRMTQTIREASRWLEQCNRTGILNGVTRACRDKQENLVTEIVRHPSSKKEMDVLMVLCAVRIENVGPDYQRFHFKLGCESKDRGLLNGHFLKQIDDLLRSCAGSGGCGELSGDVKRYVDRKRQLCDMRMQANGRYARVRSEWCSAVAANRLENLESYGLSPATR